MEDAEGKVIPGQTGAFKLTCQKNSAGDGTDVSSTQFKTSDCSDEGSAATVMVADTCTANGVQSSSMIDCSAGSMVAPTMLAAVAAVAALFL